jgi:aminopeptidase C
MKQTILLACMAIVASGAFAQEGNKAPEDFQFTTIDSLAITSVKDQRNSGTCWNYSGLGYFEAELLRMGKGEYDLCESFVCYHTYMDRADKAVRTHGDVSFSEGGSFYDVAYCLKNYGIVPQEAMPFPGSLYGDSLFNFRQLMKVAGAVVNTIAKGDLKPINPVWKKDLCSIFEHYFGALPETFEYKGKSYTPQTYAQSLGLNMDDYISLTSFNHKPFYEQFVIEVPDNWRWDRSYNLPLDEFMEVCDYAVKNGYTFAWASDVSETGFSRKGVMTVPDAKAPAAPGTDQARWTGLSESQRRNEMAGKPGPELTITQELRQEGYDKWETTDDHGMVVFGIAKDQTGKEYFMVKNSWGASGDYKGTYYASKAFVAYKTTNILVHKDGIPKNIRKKLGIK